MRVAIDIDGVSCDHVTGLTRWVLEHWDVRFKKSQVKEWDIRLGSSTLVEALREAYQDPAFVTSLPTTVGAKSALRELSLEYDVFMSSNRPDYSRAATRTWVREKLGPYPVRFVSTVKDRIRADVLVDDLPRNIFGFARRNRLGILFTQPWNASEPLTPITDSSRATVRARGWSEVLGMVNLWAEGRSGAV